MAKHMPSTIYADPQKIPAKYRKYKLKDCSVPILRRKRPKKFEMGYWDEHKKIEKYLSKEKIPDFTMRDVANMCTNYKCLETVKWITRFVYGRHKAYFENEIVSVCDLTKKKIDGLAKNFSKRVQPELRKHYIMECIAKDFDVYVHASDVIFHNNMIVSYIASHLRFKFDRQEFLFAATQYVCQRIMERGYKQRRHVLFTPYRIGSEGWHGLTKDEPLNYFVFEGKNFPHNGIFPSKEDFEEAVTDFSMFKAGIIIKTRSHHNQRGKQGNCLLPEKRKFESEKDNPSYELQPRKRGRPKKSEAEKKDLPKRGQPAKRRKLEISKENFSDQQHKEEMSRERIRLAAEKEEKLLKYLEEEKKEKIFLPISDMEDVESSADECDYPTPGPSDEHASTESILRSLETTSSKPWSLLNIFDADIIFLTTAEAMKYYYKDEEEEKPKVKPKKDSRSLLCHRARHHCSPYVSVIHC